jgi:peptidoglycan/xylan/chitin deacetylase (PgdA/CDA1 family)
VQEQIQPIQEQIQPIQQEIIQPIQQEIIQPIEHQIQPVQEEIIQPIQEQIQQPIQEEIVQPIQQEIAQPIQEQIIPQQQDIQSLISQRPELGRIIRTCNAPGRLALTFDDGPLDNTPQLLDVLRNEGIRATFFVVGQNQGSSNWASLVRRIFQEGHQVGSHTLSHLNLDSCSSSERQSQMLQNDELIRSAIGVSPTYMRPPFGECAGECLSDLSNMGYRVINYNIDTNDWQGDMAASRSNYLGSLQAGNPQQDSFIALAHDIHGDTVGQLVPFMIQQARAMGYQFSTVGECLGEDQSNWYRSGSQGFQQQFVPTQGNFLGGQQEDVILGGQDSLLGGQGLAEGITSY